VSGTIPKKKPSAYLGRVLQETEAIIREAEEEDEAVQGMKDLISRRLVQSFRNGIQFARKRPARLNRPGEGKDGRGKSSPVFFAFKKLAGNETVDRRGFPPTPERDFSFPQLT
jgi:hypothetical protein